MSNQEEFREDILRQYINPEKIEKAPEGFTSKVMTQIQLEPVPVKNAGILRNKNLVPLISTVITIFLVVAAFLIPGSEADSSALPVLQIIKNIRVSLPEVDLASILRLNIPASMIYVFIGILMLTLFDRALNVLFHRREE
jgi:hypothetical protein